jgi:hypothetical protein
MVIARWACDETKLSGFGWLFCRFHVVSEFDDAKRSCRRRLAGHNERRRKGSLDSVSRNSSHGTYVISFKLTCFYAILFTAL